MVNCPRIQPHISAVPSTEEELSRMLAGTPVIALWSSICNERKKKRVVKTFPIKMTERGNVSNLSAYNQYTKERMKKVGV